MQEKPSNHVLKKKKYCKNSLDLGTPGIPSEMSKKACTSVVSEQALSPSFH